MSTCRSCQAEVVFVPSAKTGKAMILDAETRKGVILTDPSMNLHGLVGLVKLEEVSGRAEANVVDVFTDHHATCPNADAWKGKHR
jgi:hypothetical protein